MEFEDLTSPKMSTRELQALLRGHGWPNDPKAIRRYVDAGGFKRHQLVPGGRVQYDRTEVLAWIESRCTTPTPGQVA